MITYQIVNGINMAVYERLPGELEAMERRYQDAPERDVPRERPVQFPAWLEEQLRVRHWNRKTAARRIGVSAPALGDWLLGYAALSQQSARKVAGVLGVDPVALRRFSQGEGPAPEPLVHQGKERVG